MEFAIVTYVRELLLHSDLDQLLLTSKDRRQHFLVFKEFEEKQAFVVASFGLISRTRPLHAGPPHGSHFAGVLFVCSATMDIQARSMQSATREGPHFTLIKSAH